MIICCQAFVDRSLASGRLEHNATPDGMVLMVTDQLKHRTPHKTHASGTFEAFTLFDLLVTLTQKPEPYRLHLLIGGEEAVIVVKDRHVVMASYQDKLGEEAVMSIFSTLENDHAAEFLLEPFDAGLNEEVWAIKTPLEQLLLAVATMLDKQRARKPPVSAKAARTHVRKAAKPEAAPARWRFKLFKLR